MDDIGLHPAFSEPARQPEAVTPGLIGNDNALKRPTRFCGLVPPTLQKPEQRVPIRLKLLQRLAVNPGHNPCHDPCHDPCHEPACLAHLDHHNQGAILLKGSEGSAQVVRLWHGGTSSVLSSDDRASPLAAPHSISSDLAITTALTLKAVFRLALRQTEGLIGSVIRLLGLALSVPDHTTLSRRAETLEVPRPRSGSPDTGREAEPVHLLVDSTGLKLCGAGEWLVEKHGTKTRRSWRKMHIGVDADTGRIVASVLTTHDVDDGSQVGPLLDQVTGAVASVTGDGASDQDGVYASVGERHPEAAVIVPPRATAVPSATAETAPTKRDRHLQLIAERGRMGWQKASGYTKRARAEATIGRFKRVIGDGLRSRTDQRQATEMDLAVQVLNRMLELGRPESVRIA